MRPPLDGDDWVALSAEALPVADAHGWVRLDSCGAVALFSGHARDHSPGRPGVVALEYEAYEEQVEAVLTSLCAELRGRWPDIGRIALLHRHGALAVGDTAVVVAVSAPHRDVAFEAARHGIDTLKAEALIWKRERWAGGESWGLESTIDPTLPAAGSR